MKAEPRQSTVLERHAKTGRPYMTRTLGVKMHVPDERKPSGFAGARVHPGFSLCASSPRDSRAAATRRAVSSVLGRFMHVRVTTAGRSS